MRKILIVIAVILFIVFVFLYRKSSISEPQQEVLKKSWWILPLKASFQWQLAGEPIDLSVDAEVFDIDLFNNDASVVASLHKKGKKVICYVNVGAWENWRADKDEFPKEVIGNVYEGFEDERWLDIRRIDIIGPIMQKRFDMCRDKGFDGLEPDNIDGYTNDTRFSITSQDQLKYNAWLAEEAHKRGLSIGFKNDPDQAKDLEQYFDWALTEDCFDQGWCDKMSVFVEKNKAVFMTEYTDTGVKPEEFCPVAKKLQFNAIFKNRGLDTFRGACRY